jgi:hypothetical protein
MTWLVLMVGFLSTQALAEDVCSVSFADLNPPRNSEIFDIDVASYIKDTMLGGTRSQEEVLAKLRGLVGRKVSGQHRGMIGGPREPRVVVSDVHGEIVEITPSKEPYVYVMSIKPSDSGKIVKYSFSASYSPAFSELYTVESFSKGDKLYEVAVASHENGFIWYSLDLLIEEKDLAEKQKIFIESYLLPLCDKLVRWPQVEGWPQVERWPREEEYHSFYGKHIAGILLILKKDLFANEGELKAKTQDFIEKWNRDNPDNEINLFLNVTH